MVDGVAWAVSSQLQNHQPITVTRGGICAFELSTCTFVASSCHPERRSTTLVKKCNHGLVKKSDHVAKSVDRFRGLIYMIFPACRPGPYYDRWHGSYSPPTESYTLCTPHNQLIFLSTPEKSRFDTTNKVSWYAYLIRATYSPIRRTGKLVQPAPRGRVFVRWHLAHRTHPEL